MRASEQVRGEVQVPRDVADPWPRLSGAGVFGRGRRVGFDFEGIGEMGVGGVLQCSATSAAGHDTLEFTPGFQVDCEPWHKVMEPLLFTQSQELAAPADALRHIAPPVVQGIRGAPWSLPQGQHLTVASLP